jgi:hypothetical protein
LTIPLVDEIDMSTKGGGKKTSLYLEKINTHRLNILAKKGIKLDLNMICNRAIKEHLDNLEKENPALFKE